MSRQRAGKRRNFVTNNPDEKFQLSELIEGIRQYQDEEYKAMQAEFDRVEQLLASEPSSKLSRLWEPNAKVSNLWKTRSLPTDKTQPQDQTTENPPHCVQEYRNTGVVQNHYRYVKWILLFFLMLFFGMLTKLYTGRLVNNVVSIFEYLRLKIKN
ncbi:uncharacterized protein LOC119081839 [Bradysia coprophila]|uniref:uncharacterized protein LOC119081839 n=1 Tax=Bradysia coprophila TaxID=38358 RepID=UPI00187DD5B2|nr:uncharacterized protein LOC119081839 [Bradysia coprophila]